MKIAVTSFVQRHWDPTSSATQIEDFTPEELVAACDAAVDGGASLVPGYAPFCSHMFLENTASYRCAFAPITDDNRQHLRSGYQARRPGELAVLERWFEGIPAPRARYLDVILYSHAQLLEEAAAYADETPVPECDWGIVAILGTLEPREPPMPPITQIRNALGKNAGGSGVPIDLTTYERAVAFWETHASVK